MTPDRTAPRPRSLIRSQLTFAPRTRAAAARPSARSLATLGALLLALAALLTARPSAAEGNPDSTGVEGGSGMDATLPDADPGEIIPGATVTPAELERGQRGWGLSVFAGTERERFEVEVLGILQNSTPELSYIMARLEGQGLEHSGVLAGMSGSPVYFDGKLAGAVAFSFAFGKDPIAGITPIAAMRQLQEAGGGLPQGAVPAAAAALPEGAWLPTVDDLVRRDFDPAILHRQLAMLRPRTSAAGRPAMVWTAGGFGNASMAVLEQALGGVVPVTASVGSGLAFRAGLGGGGDTVLGDGSLAPGDAVAVSLVRGDLVLAAHGTVTDRVGDSVLAFGHPIYSLGPARLPMAESEVITTVPSVQNSFKLSNIGGLIGVFDQDREAGAHGILGETPSLMPLTIRLRGLVEREYSMQLANSSLFKPTLIAAGSMGALEAGSHAAGYQGLDLEARFRIDGHEDLWLRQSFDGNQAATDCVLYLLTFAAFLEFNELEKVSVEEVEVEIHQVDRPRNATLVAAYPERRRVAPGERVGVHLELQPFRGERLRRRVEVQIADDAADGKYWVMVGDGTSMDAARLEVEKRDAETFRQTLDLLRSFNSRRDLHLVGLVAGNGLSLAGATLPDLPGSVRSVFGQAGVGEGLQLRIATEQVERLDRPVDGILRIDLEVRRPRT